MGWMALAAQTVAIEFEGNTRTKSDFLLQVLGCCLDVYDEDALKAGLRRLKNLAVLAEANAEVSATDTLVRVVVKVEEAPVIWPILTFGGVEGNRWFMAGVSDFNTAGRAIQSTVFYRNIDGEHNAFVSVDVPLMRQTRFGYGIEVQRYAAIEPLFFAAGAEGISYRYANFTFAPRVSYAFDFQHRVVFGLSYLHERYERVYEGSPTSLPFPTANAIKNKYVVNATHLLNRVNVFTEQREGWAVAQQFQLINDVGTFANPFTVYWVEGQYFVRRGVFNLALRGRLGVADNAVNPFAPFVLDSQLNIRGAGNRVDRGTATAVLNTELRCTVYRGDRFGFQAVGFSDLGNWRKPGGTLDELTKTENLQHFTGLGLRLFYTRSQLALLRIDYGVNVQSTTQRGVVVGVGQFF
ncbi:MAG: hypothetical protein ACFCUH_12465 [Flavobacteriales bacterium]